MTIPCLARATPHGTLPDAPRLRVLTFTSLFPNVAQPLHGTFVHARIQALSKLCDVQVIAPIPWTFDSHWVPDRYRTARPVPAIERAGELRVLHPRFFTIPKVAKSLDGLFMARSCRDCVMGLGHRFPFDVLDAHWAYPDGVAAALIARELHRPFSVTVRGDDINVFAAETLRRPWIRWALQQASLVIAVSEDLRRAVIALAGPQLPIAVIPNGIDVERFRPINRATARRQLGLDPAATVLLSVGRLHESKGYPVLVRALARLLPVQPRAMLAIVGGRDPEADPTGEILAVASELGVANQVVLAGPQDPTDLVKWYSAADVFCLATSREGSPNVLREALACGVPCVATPVGGIPELISPDVGELVQGTPADFAAAIERVLRRSWDASRLRNAAALRGWDEVALECREALYAAATSSRALSQ
jgi:glycosyltransferase involved in cell wall biosynthesis